MNRYENNHEHLMAELKRIDLRLRFEIMRMRQRNGDHEEDKFRGLYVSENEIDDFVSLSTCCWGRNSSGLNSMPQAIALKQLEEEISLKKSVSLNTGVVLRLSELANMFNLSDFELDILLICLLPEIDTKYERIFAYLHDDVTRKRPSVDLILQCLLNSLDERLAARELFLPQAPLIAHHLLRLGDDSTIRSTSLLVKNLKVDDRIVNYLLGSDQIDARLTQYVRVVIHSVRSKDLVLSESNKKRLKRIISVVREDADNHIIYLQGPGGIGKKTIADLICRSGKMTLLMVDVASLLSSDLPVEIATELVLREAKLLGNVICWNRFDLFLSENQTPKYDMGSFIEGIISLPHLVLATGETMWQPSWEINSKPFIRIEFDFPSYAIRKQLWEVYLNRLGTNVLTECIEEIAEKFRFTPGQISSASVVAQNISLSKGESQISALDLYAACRFMSSQKLTQLTRKVQPRFEWNDIILPNDQMEQLREIANQVKYRHIVFADWNFEHKMSLRKGLNVLFAGPSGTGKTMAAEIVANELGLDLYKIDLATVISKYIGETEKNLDRIFIEAQNSNSILFFDEADAIFGKRSEIRDSHDRYANIEVAYLLQKMEEYDGIVILATNLRKNIDEAFARRMHYHIEFPQPDEADRFRIWQGVFPPEAPVLDDIDLRFMARQFRITGGNVKNIALGSAFLAASDGGVIKMEHLIRSTKREYQKIGKLCTEADFGCYYEKVRG
ncbi:AAA family ATPase [Chloroflexota bacterium]